MKNIKKGRQKVGGKADSAEGPGEVYRSQSSKGRVLDLARPSSLALRAGGGFSKRCAQSVRPGPKHAALFKHFCYLLESFGATFWNRFELWGHSESTLGTLFVLKKGLGHQ